MTIKNSIDQATAIIRESGAVELVRAWMSEDGHAPASSEWLRTVLVGWVATALAGRPLTEQHVAKTVKKMPGSTVTTEQVARVTRRVLEVIDYSPLPASDGPLTKNEYEAVLAGRRLNATSLELKRLRFLEFTNALLLAQRDLVPELVGRKYDVALGSVFRAAGVAGLGHASYERLAGSDCVSLEPDAGFVHLHSDPDNFGYGWRSEVATLVPDTMEAPAIAASCTALGTCATRSTRWPRPSTQAMARSAVATTSTTSSRTPPTACSRTARWASSAPSWSCPTT